MGETPNPSEKEMTPEEVVQQLRARIPAAHRSQPSFLRILTVAANLIEKQNRDYKAAYTRGVEDAATYLEEMWVRDELHKDLPKWAATQIRCRLIEGK